MRQPPVAGGRSCGRVAGLPLLIGITCGDTRDHHGSRRGSTGSVPFGPAALRRTSRSRRANGGR